MSASIFAPAKINLLLAITGVRPDGFHALVSLVAPIGLGDTLRIELRPDAPADTADTLECDAPGVPTDTTNLVLRTARVFREQLAAAAAPSASTALPPVRFILEKRTPHGAGLGGGSSDAAAALRLLNAAIATPFPPETLAALAARLGSDCPLFLAARPVVMRGRGEQLEPLGEREIVALRGRRLLVFKPAFAVSTAAAYAAMKAAAPAEYVPAAQAERLLADWRAAPAIAPLPLFNNMEGVVFRKHAALPALLALLAGRFQLAPRMSGSGSACFALLPDDFAVAPAVALIRESWGASAFIHETTIL